MIWSLALEQLRAQRRYVAWTAAVVTLAVAVASYGAMLVMTTHRTDAVLASALGTDREHLAWVQAAPTGGDERFAPLAAITEAVDTAANAGTPVTARADLVTTRLEPLAGGGDAPVLSALRGDVDWSRLLLEGAAPAAGQVAMSAAYADSLGVGIGDTVRVYAGDAGSAPLGIVLTVSGVAASPFDTAGLGQFAPAAAWVAWDDLDGLVRTNAQDIQIIWDGDNPTLSGLFGADIDGFLGYNSRVGTTSWVGLATLTLIVGVVAMGFALGRSQAQARSQWVATASALGARRRDIALASLAEALLLALAAAVVGLALGWVAASGHLALVHAAVPGAAVASVAGLSAATVIIAAALALTLSLIIAAVPAFWAARTQPVAALKPETDLTTAEVSRRVAFWPVAVVWVLAGAGAIAVPVSLVVFAPLSVVVANEALRRVVPPVARFLSRRPEKVAIVAGDAIVARPRQYTVPAFLLALATGVLLATALAAVARHLLVFGDPEAFFVYLPELVVEARPPWLVAATVVVMGAMALMATVIAVATQAATAREHATREALGISSRQTRAAAGLAQGVVLALGILAGLGFGLLYAAVDATAHGLWGLLPVNVVGNAFAPVVGAVLLGAVVATVVSAVAAGAARTLGTPSLPTQESTVPHTL